MSSDIIFLIVPSFFPVLKDVIYDFFDIKFCCFRVEMRSDFHNDRFGGNRRPPPRRDEEPMNKRGRFENASDTYEAQFNRKPDAGARVMLTFKKFLATQDESISDDEAILKYNEYKFEYRKQEYEKFFQAHKDEEW